MGVREVVWPRMKEERRWSGSISDISIKIELR